MSETTPASQLVRKRQLATLLSVSPHPIDGWVAKRMIPFIEPNRVCIYSIRRAVVRDESQDRHLQDPPAVFDATDDDSASFVDSNVIAAILGTINLSGVNPTTLDSTAFGVAFRTSAGGAGLVKIDGAVLALVPAAANGKFNYLGLAG
jgi:hypothetical protein